jgi:serine/threonine-protein kinase
MSPEQIRSAASADARSDLWSLGVVLYELLAGVEAFRADTVTGICAAVLESEPEPLERLRPEVPVELVEVVARCLAKDPADRYANVAELADALLPFAPARALVSVERTSSLMRTAPVEHARQTHVTSVRPNRRRSGARSNSPSIEPSPASDAPFARSVAVEASRGGARGRRSVLTMTAAAVIMVTLTAVALAHRAGRVELTAAPAAARADVASEAKSSTPIAIEIHPSPDRPSEKAERVQATATKRSEAAPPRAAGAARASARPPPVLPASASAPASVTATASASATTGAAPTGAPTVELGY